MPDIQTIEPNHHFTHVTGEIRLSVGPDKSTLIGVNGRDAIDIWNSVKDWANDNTVAGERVVIQYVPGIPGYEAGSRWFDIEAVSEDDIDWHDLATADQVLGYLLEIDNGFAAGKAFVA